MKDSYWFKHDSNASRDMKLLKIKVLYDFWGIGLFWSVVELLREQNNYCFPSDESGLDMVCSLVSCSDSVRFHNWFNDCLRLGLFELQDGIFYSHSLCERMEKWEVKKGNGDKGGRPKADKQKGITETVTELQTEQITESITIREDKIREDNKKKNHLFENDEIFDFTKFKEAVRLYSGGKYQNADMGYYYDAIKTWSLSKGSMKKDWLATAIGFMLRDIRDDKFKRHQ